MKDKYLYSGLWFFLVVNFLALLWYIFVGYQAFFHTDSASQYLLAREMLNTHSFFPEGWNYVNGDIWVYMNQALIFPFLLIFPSGYLPFAASRVVNAALVLLGTFLVTRMLTRDTKILLLTLAIFLGGLSLQVVEHLYGQASYAAFYYFSCFLIYFSWKYFYGDKKFLFIGISVVGVIHLLAFWGNPYRALVVYTAPLFLSVAVLFLKDQNYFLAHRLKIACFILALLVTGVCGGVLYQVTLGHVNMATSIVHGMQWVSFQEMVTNVVRMVEGILANFGSLPDPGRVILTKRGIYEGLRFISGLSMLVMIPTVILRVLKNASSFTCYFATFALSSFLMVSFLQVTASIVSLAHYYLIPAQLLILILFLGGQFLIKKSTMVFSLLVLINASLLTAYYTAFTKDSLRIYFPLSWPKIDSSDQRLVDFLIENELHYGYATFWNAGVLTVLSDEKVQVRQVELNQDVPMPYRWLSSNRWYLPLAWQGESFLILTEQEEKAIDWKLMASHQAVPIRVLEFEGKKIFVFKENLATLLPGWDPSFQENLPITPLPLAS